MSAPRPSPGLPGDIPGEWPPSTNSVPVLNRPSSRDPSADIEAGLSTSSDETRVPRQSTEALAASEKPISSRPSSSSSSSISIAPIRSPTHTNAHGEELHRVHTTRGELTEDEIFRALSRRKTHESAAEEAEVDHEIERLLSTIFGSSRQAGSEEEKTRHVGVVFKNLSVKGLGLGASLQPTVGDIFMGLPRTLGRLFSGKGLQKTAVRTLINNFSGVVKPSEMILVLGRPGSGCSTFLKVIANQRSGYEEVTGDVTYGGTDHETMAKNYRGEVLYNPEDDLHYATITVRDTLSFAIKTRTPPKSSRREGESRADYVREFLRVVSKLFWIEHTLGTKVGNAIVRGVSGGEKKRVSIAEAMITKASSQCWDNSTTGLDAATAMEYVSSLRTLTNMAKISTFVALYQAGESLYNLFDKVVVIDEGKCVYLGPTESARKYFEDMGFEAPARWTTADFLVSVTDPNERNIKAGYENRVPKTAEEFEATFNNSEVAKNNLREIAEFEDGIKEQVAERARQMGKDTAKKNYSISYWAQVKACTDRQFKVMRGDPMSLGGKWGGILFQSLIVGSLFYNLESTTTGVFPRGGIMFFTLLFNALLALAELTAAFSSRPIMLKHKSFSFYRPSAFALAQVVADLPLCAVQVLIWSIVIYFMSNLQRTASQFFIFILITYFLTLTMYSFFRMIGAFSASLDAATRITGVAIQALVVYTGYLIPPSSMHPWFSWIRWINPVQYSFEALMSNEFYNLDIKCEAPYLIPPYGDPASQSCALRGSTPGSQTVSGADYISSQYTYTRSHLWRNFGIIVAFWIFFVVVGAVGQELQKPNKGGAAVIVFKRGQVPEHIEKEIEAGKNASDEEIGEKEPVPTKHNNGSNDSLGGKATQVAKNDTVFTWQNVTYTIPYQGGTKTLLNDVQGYVRPGKLTALMGESGAGKTTLLNTLAQRINFGTVNGSFLVDGSPLPLSFQRATGFAEQQDVHMPTDTVREAMRFSALLRQPKEVPIAEKYEYVERIISLLEMDDIAGATVGANGTGLNQEQKKRLTIGVELASKPELLFFLDEPTSGLDSGAAFNIVRFLRKLADAGQAILCTIHQPSAILFENFDELLLLKSGGSVVYHGPLGKDSQSMIRYFETNNARKCRKDENPAEYMLDAIGAGDPNRKEKDWGEVWKASPEYQERSSEIAKFIEDRKRATANDGGAKVDAREYAMPWSTQAVAVVKRSFISYWRSPEYIIGKFMLHIFTGLFNSFTFWSLGNTSIDMQSRLFSIFMTLTISPPLIQQLQPRFLKFRDLFTARERNSKIYHWTAMVLGAILVELPYSIVAGTIYFCCWYYPAGFPRTAFNQGYIWMLLMLFEVYYVSFGQAIASFSPNELLASLLVPVFFLFVVSFCGVVVPYAAIPTFWRSFMYHLSPFRYLLEGLLGVVAHNVPVKCAEKEFATMSPPSGQSCEDYLQPYIQQAGGYVQTASDGMCQFCQYAVGDEFTASFNIFYEHRWRDYGIFWAYCIFNFGVVFACTWLYLGGATRLMKRFKKN